jgi:hypothetical protein
MTVETSLERQTLLNDFGVDIVLSDKTIKGIFDSPHNPLSVGGEMQFSVQETYILVETADVTGIAYGSTLTIDSDSYVVTDVQPDGTGMTTLMLEAQ